jgi:uncharacterized protein YkwD
MTTDRWLLAVLAAGFVFVSTSAHGEPAEKPSDGAKDKKSARDAESVCAVFEAHNHERAEAKLPALTLDAKLTAAAQAHADDMAAHKKMTHDGTDKSTPYDRIKRQGYQFQSEGENVASGYRNVESLMRGWMESKYHRENILGKFAQVGIAVARDDDDAPYWCVDLATPWKKLDPIVAADDVVKALNKERAAADGLAPLKANEMLTTAAMKVARQFAAADSFDLKGKGEDVFKILERLGYRFRKIAETAASGYSDVPDVVKCWIDAPENRRFVLGDFSEVGVGYAVSASGKPYWLLILARPLKK